MSAKKRTPKAGDTVIVKHENSEEAYFFDGGCLIDSTGRQFSPFKDGEESDWEKLWGTDKNWRYAEEDERNAYMADLNENGLILDLSRNEVRELDDVEGKDKVVTELEITYDFVPCDDYPYNHTFKDSVSADELQEYKDEIVRLWKLVEEMGTMADFSVSGCDKLTDRKFGMIGQKAVQRFRGVKSDGYNLFFKGEKITDNESGYRIYDYGK